MRLINTETLELHEFFDASIPSYAILSHTWGSEEVTFQDWLYARQQNPPRWGWVYIEDEVEKIKARLGYTKIVNACKQAAADQFSWIWVDTNCIDKTNSAELSEAINSMYSWYQKAEVCYGFLADVPPSSLEECATPESKFRTSRWFTRGWTLQELLAPAQVVFFSNSWTKICQKNEIAKIIRDITNIPDGIIIEPRNLSCGHASIAEIMSWASTRKTTRMEDMAYCLMGLLDINMPLLYGEGRNAFLRLQLELLQKTNDLTFLAWQQILPQPRQVTGVALFAWAFRYLETFASEPNAFRFSRFIHDAGHPAPITEAGWFGVFHWRTENPRTLNISNLGLSLSLPLVETLLPYFQYAVLPFAQNGRALWIPLMGMGNKLYARSQFPSATLSVSNSGYKSRESMITLPAHYGATRHHGASVMRYPMPRLGYGRRSQTNILLAFPGGLHGYRCLRQFPPTDPISGMGDLILCLFVEDTLPNFAYGAIEFEKPLEPDPDEATNEIRWTPRGPRLAVFFAVELGEAEDPGPKRWTCRDISWSRFDRQWRLHSTYDTDSLELRARTLLVSLTDPPSDEMFPSTWETRSPLRLEGTDSDHGIIVLDESLCDLSNAEFVVPPDGNDGDGSDTASTSTYRPTETVIVAQIIFPGQGYEEQASVRSTGRDYEEQGLTQEMRELTL